MKINKFNSFVGLMSIILVSCNVTHDNPEIKSVILEPHISKEHPSISNDFSEFEIIPLENIKEGLLTDVRKMVVTDDCMYFWDANPEPKVLSFTLNGLYRNRIGRKGHAKGEYQHIMNIAGTQKGDKIAVLTYPNAYLYDNKGKYLNSIIIKNDQGTEDVLLTDNGIYFGYFHRQERSLMTFYSTEGSYKTKIILTPCKPFGESLGVANGHLLQQDDENVYCLDVFNSCFYVVAKENPQDITKYSFNLDNMLNENSARNGETEKYSRVYSYQVCKGVIRGVIMHSKGSYDFKFTLTDNKVELVNHNDLDFSFDCCHAGYFYKVVSPIDLLDFMDTKKQHMGPIRHLLGEALKKLDGTISMTDNYYIIKMRVKE